MGAMNFDRIREIKNKILLAEHLWKEIYTESNLPAFPVCARSIAERCGIIIHAEDMDHGFQAALIQASTGQCGILYSKEIEPRGRVNFTLAHELGHFFLHRELEDIRCTVEDIENLGARLPHGRKIESEANSFASRLLIPDREVSRDIAGVRPDINLLRALANKFDTSLTATACKVVERTAKPAAVVMLDWSDRCLWAFRNDRFRGFYVPRGARVSFGTDEDEGFNIHQNKEWIITAETVEMDNFNKKILLVLGEPI